MARLIKRWVRFLELAAVGVLALNAINPQALAQGLNSPSGEIVLTIEGKIAHTNADGRADFDLAMLQSMPPVKFRTSTPWTEGVTEFEGVRLDDVLALVGATGGKLRASALNDYAADIPISSAIEAGAILAYRVDGQEMPVREKGPIWIMFPLDDRPELKTETTYSQCVWQLRRLTVKD